MTTILALGAHPDDLEFGCGAILLKEQEKGNQIHMLVLSRGEAGTAGTPEQREQEARKAAELIGAEMEFLEMGGDCHIRETLENTLTIARKIREYTPEIVLAPTLEENQHPDHFRMARMVRDACRLARYGGLEELKDLKPHSIRNLYYYAITRPSVEPDIYIDTTSVHQRWNEVMECHASQTANRKYVEMQNTRARLSGVQIGTEYAMGVYVNDPLYFDALSDITKTARYF